MKKDLVIAGSGGMGREVLMLVNRINAAGGTWNFIGFVDNQDTGAASRDDEWLMGRRETTFAALAVGSPELRRKLYCRFRGNEKIIFPNLVDPAAVLGDETVILGSGNIVCAGSILTTNVHLGDFNIVNLNCTLSHDVAVGNFVTLSMGCNLAGNVVVGDMAEIGTGTQIIQGRKVGRHAVVGAGAAVISDIGDNATAVGVPARVIKRRGQTDGKNIDYRGSGGKP